MALSSEGRTPYLQHLVETRGQSQPVLDEVLRNYQAMASNYGEVIVAQGEALALIEALARLPVAVMGMDWWCHVTEESKATQGCPHGYGGPINRLGEGWFSECVHYPPFEVEEHGIALDDPDLEPHELAERCREVALHYLTHTLPTEPFFRPCLTPSLELLVPWDWHSKNV